MAASSIARRHLGPVESLGHVLVGRSFGDYEVVLKQVVIKGVYLWLGALCYLGSVVMHVLYKTRLPVNVGLLGVEKPGSGRHGIC